MKGRGKERGGKHWGYTSTSRARERVATRRRGVPTRREEEKRKEGEKGMKGHAGVDRVASVDREARASLRPLAAETQGYRPLADDESRGVAYRRPVG